MQDRSGRRLRRARVPLRPPTELPRSPSSSDHRSPCCAVPRVGPRLAAEGLATRTAFALPQRILWEHLDDFLLVGEDDLERATLLMLETTRNLVEPAGAASVAAVLRHSARFAGRRVAVVCSGGNLAPAQLAALLRRHPVEA